MPSAHPRPALGWAIPQAPAEAADALLAAASAAERFTYAPTAHADFLIDQGRENKALALLREQPRTDGVLLRLAIAGARIKAPHAANDARFETSGSQHPKPDRLLKQAFLDQRRLQPQLESQPGTGARLLGTGLQVALLVGPQPFDALAIGAPPPGSTSECMAGPVRSVVTLLTASGFVLLHAMRIDSMH